MVVQTPSEAAVRLGIAPKPADHRRIRFVLEPAKRSQGNLSDRKVNGTLVCKARRTNFKRQSSISNWAFGFRVFNIMAAWKHSGPPPGIGHAFSLDEASPSIPPAGRPKTKSPLQTKRALRWQVVGRWLMPDHCLSSSGGEATSLGDDDEAIIQGRPERALCLGGLRVLCGF